MNSQSWSTIVAVADEQPSMAVIDLVARAEGVDPLDLEPLYHTIDPDVLDTICTASGFTGLAFTYSGHEVSIVESGDGVEVSLDGAPATADSATSVADTEPSV